MCGQPSHLHGTFKVFTGHFLMFEAYSALIHVPIFGQKTTLEELKKQALKIQQTSDCVSGVFVCVNVAGQKRRCCRLPESEAPLSPADSKCLEGCTHTHTNGNHSRVPTD